MAIKLILLIYEDATVASSIFYSHVNILLVVKQGTPSPFTARYSNHIPSIFFHIDSTLYSLEQMRLCEYMMARSRLGIGRLRRCEGGHSFRGRCAQATK